MRIKVKTGIWLVLALFLAMAVMGAAMGKWVSFLVPMGMAAALGAFFLWAAYRFDYKQFFYDGRFYIIAAVVLGVLSAFAN